HTRCLSDWSSDVCSSDLSDTVFVTNALSAPTATSVTICPNSTATLSGSCGGNCVWYSCASPCATVVGSGVFTTPTLNSNTTYYRSEERRVGKECRLWLDL